MKGVEGPYCAHARPHLRRWVVVFRSLGVVRMLLPVQTVLFQRCEAPSWRSKAW